MTELMAEIKAPGLFVDGQFVDDCPTEPVINPSDGQPFTDAPVGSVANAEAAIAAARQAFDSGPWGRMSGRDRGSILQKFTAELETALPDLLELAVLESGATRAQATGMMRSALGHAEVAAELSRTDLSTAYTPQLAETPGGPQLRQALVRRRPMGVVVAMTPYNASLLMAVTKLAPAWAMGNTVVLKPAPQTPLQSLALAQIAAAAGIPPGVLNIVTGGMEVGVALSSDPRVDMISFTGSDAVGGRIMAQAAPSITKVVLELGGKSVMIVRPDADLGLAASIGASNITLLAGQGCALLTRHLVHQDVVAEYLERLKVLVSQQVVGPADEPGTTVGPVITAEHRQHVFGHIDRALNSGATAVIGGSDAPVPAAGFFVAPTVLTDVDSNMTAVRQEIFGPVGVVQTFTDDAEAVRMANESDYGLSGAVIGTDLAGAFAVADGLRTGRVAINAGGSADNRLPFGGFKRSGIGREFGREGALEFTQTTAISW